MKLLACILTTFLSVNVDADELTIWHDLGEKGDTWLSEVSKEYNKVYPDYEIIPKSFSTDSWLKQSVHAIKNNEAPDLLFNNYERVIHVQNETRKILDLNEYLRSIPEIKYLTQDDLRIAKYKNRLVILPIQRVKMALGFR